MVRAKWGIGTSYACRKVAVLVLRNGRAMACAWPCNAWGCDECAERKVEEMIAQIKYVNGGAEVFAGTLATGKQWASRTRTAQREGVGFLGVKRHGGESLLIAGAALRGRGWELALIPFAELHKAILSRPVRRVDWCREWRPQPEERESKALYRVHVGSMRRAAEVMEAAGVDQTTGVVPGLSPAETAARLEELLTLSR